MTALTPTRMNPDKIAGLGLEKEEPFIPPDDILEGEHKPRGRIGKRSCGIARSDNSLFCQAGRIPRWRGDFKLCGRRGISGSVVDIDSEAQEGVGDVTGYYRGASGSRRAWNQGSSGSSWVGV